MLCYVKVDAATAVKAGKTQSGIIPVTITEEFLLGLTMEERETISAYVRSGPSPWTVQDYECINGTSPSMPTVPDPSHESLLVLIRARLAERQKREAEEAEKKRRYADAVERANRLVLEDPTAAVYPIRSDVGCWGDGETHSVDIGGLHVQFADLSAEAQRVAREFAATVKAELATRQAEAKRRAAAEEAQRKLDSARFTEACAALVREFGTDDQRGRLDDDLLPDEELLKIVRDHVFTDLTTFPRYEKLTSKDVEHEFDGEYLDECGGEVDFSAGTVESLVAETWRNLKAIQAAAPEGATVTPRYHAAMCDRCGAETERFSALVSVEWHGRQFSREYAI